MTFESAVAFILEHEGEESADSRDPGGFTRWGISKRAHPDVDLATLTVDGARELYHQRYWKLTQCDKLPAVYRLPLLDAAVQHGPITGIRLLQDALGVARDGIIGPATLGAASSLPIDDVLSRFFALRCRLYAAQPHQAVFGLGWFRRLFDCHRTVYDYLNGGHP